MEGIKIKLLQYCCRFFRDEILYFQNSGPNQKMPEKKKN